MCVCEYVLLVWHRRYATIRSMATHTLTPRICMNSISSLPHSYSNIAHAPGIKMKRIPTEANQVLCILYYVGLVIHSTDGAAAKIEKLIVSKFLMIPCQSFGRPSSVFTRHASRSKIVCISLRLYSIESIKPETSSARCNTLQFNAMREQLMCSAAAAWHPHYWRAAVHNFWCLWYYAHKNRDWQTDGQLPVCQFYIRSALL